MTGAWAVERLRGRAADLHGRPLGDDLARTLTVLEVERPALVLGSTQSAAVASTEALAAAGVDLARRRSGGGAVLVEPGSSTWVDLDLPRGDPLWDDDVGRAARWVGDAWARALRRLGVADVAVHDGGLVATRWSALVCFAGWAPGEVGTTGRKVVGVASRRSRAGARFQCGLARAWRPGPLLDLLAIGPGERAAAAAALAGVATGLDRPPEDVVGALVEELPSGSPV